MTSWIDLRSDTVTQPTLEMRQAMFDAEVGDDVYGDDPTVNRLETLAAQLLQKEAALLVPSGTFGNQLCLLTHTQRGQEVLMPETNHILWHEVGASAVIAGVQIRPLSAPYGKVDLNELRKKIRGQDIHEPSTGLICLENAHSSGCVVPLSHLQEVYQLAQSYKIPLHIDGARLFNAATALKTEVSVLAQYADSIQICLSKGLCAPVGSLVFGTKAFIHKARKNRKLMGGGMRQAGILAAAGIIALEKMALRLEEDHQNAKYLASLLALLPGVRVFSSQLDINMVFFQIDFASWTVSSSQELVQFLQKKQILMNGAMEDTFRLVTHYGIQKEHLDQVYSSLKDLIRKVPS